MYLEARREDAGDIRPVDHFTHYHLFALTTGYQQQQLVDCWLVAEILKSTDDARSEVTCIIKCIDMHKHRWEYLELEVGHLTLNTRIYNIGLVSCPTTVTGHNL